MEISFRQLKALRALSETGQFSRAAQQLNITQPALSAQIAALEDTLGTNLIERGPRQCRLTNAGERTLSHANDIFNALEALQNDLRPDYFPNMIRIGAIPTIAPYRMPKWISAMKRIAPKSRIAISETQTESLLAQVKSGTLDLAVLAGPITNQNFESTPLFDDELLLASLNATAHPINPAIIDENELLLLDEGHCLADQVLDYCQIKRSEAHIAASSLTTLIGMVREAHGVTFVPSIARREIEAFAPEITLTSFADQKPYRHIVAVTKKRSLRPEWLASIIDCLQENIR